MKGRVRQVVPSDVCALLVNAPGRFGIALPCERSGDRPSVFLPGSAFTPVSSSSFALPGYRPALCLFLSTVVCRCSSAAAGSQLGGSCVKPLSLQQRTASLRSCGASWKLRCRGAASLSSCVIRSRSLAPAACRGTQGFGATPDSVPFPEASGKLFVGCARR